MKYILDSYNIILLQLVTIFNFNCWILKIKTKYSWRHQTDNFAKNDFCWNIVLKWGQDYLGKNEYSFGSLRDFAVLVSF